MQLTAHARSERGFSMFLVVVGLFVASMFVAAAFAAANGDLPVSAASKDRKTAYAAAEAGLNFYETHLNQDPDYWTHCENVPLPGPGQPNPVNKVWNGVGTDPRTWRNVAGSDAQYTVEVLPAPGSDKCVEGNQSTVLNQNTGTFRIRVTGRPREGSTLKRSIIATFKRKGFLDFLWFTDFEDLDPQALTTQTARTNADNACGGKYRWERPTNGACTEIQWITGDVTDGPLHSNDSLLICGAPTFGHDRNDVIEVVPATNGRVADDHCSDNTNMLGQWQPGADPMQAPTDDQPLRAVANTPDGKLFKGRTIIRLNGATMNVTTADGVNTPSMALPANGVIFVDSDPTKPCNVTYPVRTDYTEDDRGCGNVYVSGTYSKSLTIAAANDVIIAPTSGGAVNWGSSDEGLTMQANSDAVLGLIANRFVRVGHKVNRGSPCTNYASTFNNANLEVDAAILALQHSWIVDNYDCGRTGNLTVKGAIAQEYRGPVGTSGHTTGFLKDYHYDKRFRYRSPPYFLSPIAAQWNAVRINEQVPAT
jgi:Tfp pilus assembly protein PilX